MAADFFNMKSLAHLSHNQYFYRRMMHEEGERPPKEKAHYNISALLTTGVMFAN